MRRAAWRARSGGSAATIWCRCRRSPTSPSSTGCCWRGCEADLTATIAGRSETVGEALGGERPLLRALPAEPFDACEHGAPRVDSKSLVTVRQNRYSVPVALAGLQGARPGRRAGDQIIHDGQEVARHERLHGQVRRPAPSWTTTSSCSRASPARWSARSRCARSASAARWPDCFDELWAGDRGAYGASEAARQMVDVLLLCREHGPARVELAVRGALAAGANDGRAVACSPAAPRRAQPPRR